MRLEYARFHNVGPFRDFTLDLSTLDPSALLVALVGANGTGKTFTLETALPGALYRRMRTQGTLIGRATARDSYVESRVVNGQPWTIRHDLDAVSRKGEATVWAADGLPAYEGTKVSSFEKWAKQHILSEDVLFSTLFAAQGSEGFIDLSSAERISVILQVIGVAQLERMAERARKRASVEKGKLEALRARITDARAGALDPAAAEAGLLQARLALTAAEAELETATRSLLELQEQERVFAAQRELAQVALDAASARVRQIAETRAHVADLQERIRNNRAIQADAPAVRRAVAQLAKLRPDIEKADRAVASAEQNLALIDADISTLRSQSTDAARSLQETDRALERLKVRLRDAPAIEEAAESLRPLGERVYWADDAVRNNEAALEALRGTRLAGAEDRIAELRDGLQIIADGVAEPATTATETLAFDNAAVTQAADLPEQIAELEGWVATSREQAAAAKLALSEAEKLVARAADVATARAELADISARRAEVVARAERARADLAARMEARPPAVAGLEAAKAVAQKLRRALGALEPVAAKAEQLAGAEARLAVHEPNALAAQELLARLEAEHEAAGPVTPVPPPADLGAAQAALAEAQAVARRAHAEVARAEQRSEQAALAAGRVADLEVERAAVEGDLADYVRLAADLGRDGIQSAEVDSAGPELTELVNDLLHTCHGSRFSISIETTRLSASGKDQIDECGVLVTDTLKGGRVREAREFSGGERVILGEAVSLGLTMLACRRSGVDRPTLFRDESGAALDPDNQRVYVAMLRRAAEMVGADRVLFVSHSQDVIDLADAQIRIEEAA